MISLAPEFRKRIDYHFQKEITRERERIAFSNKFLSFLFLYTRSCNMKDIEQKDLLGGALVTGQVPIEKQSNAVQLVFSEESKNKAAELEEQYRKIIEQENK